MASPMATLLRTRNLIKTLNHNTISFKTITAFTFLNQELQVAEPTHSPNPTPLPPNPASGSPLYNENWRIPISNTPLTQSLLPPELLQQSPSARIQAMSQTLDIRSTMNVFADWMTSQRWADVKQLFEFWVRSLDPNGKPNKPDVNVFNHYLRANLMTGASAGELLDFVAQMEEYNITPNTASFNLVLKAMHQAKETEAAQKLLERLANSIVLH